MSQSPAPTTVMDVDAVINQAESQHKSHYYHSSSNTDGVFEDPELEFDPLTLSAGPEAKHQLDTFAATGSAVSPVTLEFKDVRYEVDVGPKRLGAVKHILKGISGHVTAGEMLSVMGASGAGKTTLLNMLAGRLSDAGHGRSSGSITINGYKRDFDTFRHISAYVLQSDSFFPELTVRETIMLSAKLRLPHDMPMSEKKARVDAIIAELGLRKVENSYVGNELIRGVSGGERKRVNVGTELVTNPSLIFLDEPTSGLDSFNAQNVMQTLMQLAGNGRTVVATIHQPRSTITNMFDKLLLLSEGQTIYFGEAHTAVDYFAQVGYPCPTSFNPADFYLDLISLDQRSAESQRITTKRIEYLVGRYVDHAAKHDTLALPAPAEKNNAPPTSTVAKHGKYANSWFTQFKLLSQRSIRLMMREKENNIAMIAQTLLFAVLLGLIWLREGDNLNEEGGVTAIAGALFFILVNQSFGGIFGIIFLFPSERIIVLKERASRSYHVGAYFWSKTLAELPRTFVTSLVFSVIGYFMVGLRDDGDNFFRFVLILFMVTLASEGLAYIVSAIAKDPQQAGAIAPAFVVTSMLFGGFFIGSDSIPVFLFWLKYLSFLNYGFAAAMQNEFSDRMLANCTGAPEDDVCFTQGSEVLDFYKVDELSFAANLWILLALIVGFRLIAYLILLRNGPVYDLAL